MNPVQQQDDFLTDRDRDDFCDCVECENAKKQVLEKWLAFLRRDKIVKKEF